MTTNELIEKHKLHIESIQKNYKPGEICLE